VRAYWSAAQLSIAVLQRSEFISARIFHRFEQLDRSATAWWLTAGRRRL